MSDELKRSKHQEFLITLAPDLDPNRALIAFRQETSIQVKKVAEPYPSDYPQQSAMQHLQGLSELLDRILTQDEQVDLNPMIGLLQLLTDRIEANLHDTHNADIVAFMRNVYESTGERDRAIRLIAAAMPEAPTLGALLIQLHLADTGPRTSHSQAATIIDAATKAGLPDGTLRELAEFLGHQPDALALNPLELDAPTALSLLEQAEVIPSAEFLRDELLQTLGMSPDHPDYERLAATPEY